MNRLSWELGTVVSPFSDIEEGKKTPASNAEGHPVESMHIKIHSPL